MLKNWYRPEFFILGAVQLDRGSGDENAGAPYRARPSVLVLSEIPGPEPDSGSQQTASKQQ